MNNADMINAIFETGGAILLTTNVKQLVRDKKLAGVRLIPTVWFNVWEFWNLFYYYHLSQMLSWIAGFAVLIVNITWVSLAIYYKIKNNKDK